MSKNTPDYMEQDASGDQNDQLRRIIVRAIPYTPLIIFALLIGMACSWFYLRYATRTYAAKARLIVNDDSQQKNTNLLEAVQIDTRDLSAETEREMEILRSRDLLNKLVSKLQLNVNYTRKGFIKSGEFYNNVPFNVELQNPDSITFTVSAVAKVINNKVLFDGITFPVDTMVGSKFGNLRWHINYEFLTPGSETDDWEVTIQPVANLVGSIKGALNVKPISKYSSILELTYTDEIPERGVNILNNLITLYGTTSVDYKSRISSNTLNFLDGRLQLVQDELSGVEKKLQSFKTTEGIVDLGAEGSLFLSQLKDADIKIAELDVQMDVLTQIERYVKKRNNEKSSTPATLGIIDPILTTLLTQLYQTEFELEKIKKISGDKNPQINVYEEAISKLKPSIVVSINNLKLDIATKRERLQKDNNKLSATISKIPKKERLLLDITRQQGIKDAIFTFLLQKREESAIAASSILPNFRVIEKPEQAGMVAPRSQKIYVFGVSIALFLTLIFIYLREFSNTRLLFRSQIENKLPVPIIAELSFQPNQSGSPVVVGLGSRSLIGEQFRELRTNLNYITAVINEKCKVILVTSSIPKEGKSFVAINTAITLTLTGAKVVLIEGDMRNPKVSKPLDIISTIGMSTYLIKKATENEIIIAHPNIENLSVIPSGPIPPNPTELLSTERLAQLITYLKEHFDYVIIDSPPVGAVTDAKILAAISHATLYIIRHNYTDNSHLQLISNINQQNFLPNLNIVYNGITTKKILGYSYGKGYGYGYTYEYGENKPKKKK